MEGLLSPSSEDIRIAESPRRSPQITEGLGSPVKSVHPPMQQIDSMHNNLDFGLRTTDFFEDHSSDDDSPEGGRQAKGLSEDNGLPAQGSIEQRRQSAFPNEALVSDCQPQKSSVSRPELGDYQPLTPSIAPEEANRVADGMNSSSSLVGSVDELLPGGGNSSPPQFTGPTKSSFRLSSQPSSAGNRLSGIDQTLGAYAIAHEITLHALMRDENALSRGFQPYSSTQKEPGDRRSMLSFGRQRYSKGPQPNRFSNSPSEAKKVHLVPPPPIEISDTHRSLPEDIVRTPYPFPPAATHAKDEARDKNIKFVSKQHVSTESVLTFCVRTSNPHSRCRMTRLTVPASNDFSVVRSKSPRSKEQHFKALDFDDAAFFTQLRRCYRELMGPMRLFSARSLRQITVSGPAVIAADRGYWLHPPKSPLVVTPRSLNGGSSRERIMQYYRKPALGKSRYAFVHWAHQLAAATSSRQPLSGQLSGRLDEEDNLVGFDEESEMLQFVIGWSARRILLALLIVLIASIASTSLWIFLGHITAPGVEPHGGFRDAGDRVTSGVLMGVGVLLLGLSSIAGWMGVSWLVM